MFGLVLVAAGLGVTGAYLGTPLSLAVTAVVLVVDLAPRGSARPRRRRRDARCATSSAAPGRP